MSPVPASCVVCRLWVEAQRCVAFTANFAVRTSVQEVKGMVAKRRRQFHAAVQSISPDAGVLDLPFRFEGGSSVAHLGAAAVQGWEGRGGVCGGGRTHPRHAHPVRPLGWVGRPRGRGTLHRAGLFRPRSPACTAADSLLASADTSGQWWRLCLNSVLCVCALLAWLGVAPCRRRCHVCAAGPVSKRDGGIVYRSSLTRSPAPGA